MPRLVLILLLVNFAAAQKLEVTAATAKHVALSWSGTAKSWTLERKSGAAPFQKVASPTATTYDDSTISGDAVYQYRVRGDAGVSNEVTVGPPAAGVQKIAPLPAGADPEHYGTKSALALDENGDPAIAFLWFDPNNDGDRSDTEVRFVRWDRAAYRWTPAAKVATVGDISDCCEPVSLAIDPASSTVALAYPVGGANGVTVSFSADHGATWTALKFSGVEAPADATAIAWHNGHVQLAANFGEAGPLFLEDGRTDLNDSTPKWKSTPVPKAGSQHQGRTPVSLAYDPGGAPLVAFYDAAANDNFVYGVWRPGSTSAQIAVDTHSHPADGPDVSLTFGGGHFGILVAAQLEPEHPEFGVWYSSSKDGATWSKPVKLPIDGPRSINRPLDLAIDSKGRTAAVFGSNSGGAAPPCGAPEMSTSADGAAWSTCSFAGKLGLPEEVQPSTLRARYSNGDKLYVLWPVIGENKYGRGMLLWRQP